MAVMFFLIVIVDFGSDIIGVKEVSVNRNDNGVLARIFSTTYAAKFLLAFGLVTILSLLFLLVPYFATEKKMFFMSLVILVAQFANPIWFLQGIEYFKAITVINIATKLLYLAGIFFTINNPDDYVYVNLWWGIGMFLPFLIGSVWCVNKFEISFGSLRVNDISHFITKDYKFCVSQLFLSMKNYSPILLIGFAGGFNIAGQYKIIEQIIMPIRTYLQVIFRFFYPKLCFEIFQDKMNGVAFWKKVNIGNFLVVIFLLAMIYIFATEILLFFKVAPNSIENLSLLLRFSLLIPLLITVSFTFEQLIFSIGKRDIYIKITIATVIINFIVMFFLFQIFGLFGLISSLLITETMVVFAYLVVLKPFFNQNPTEILNENI